MKIYVLAIGLLIVTTMVNCANQSTDNTSESMSTESVVSDSLVKPGEEQFFKSLRQLSFGGDNAEAYWSFDDTKLVMQVTNPAWNVSCDQIFYMDVAGEKTSGYKPTLVSTGKGRTTCSYFLPGDSTIIYASTHLAADTCPPTPPHRSDGKYVWPIYASFDIFKADLQGNILAQMTNTPGYDAEATVSPKGDKIVFTSLRNGDLDLYTMNLDGSDVKQVTNELGYDGGAFFSPDGTQLIFRASRPKTEEAIREYKELLQEGLVTPTEMELFICNVDGTDLRQITSLGKANWCPFFHPSGKKVIFASNYATERGFPFNLYMINLDGTGLTKVTADGTFDAFPVFSNDGKYLVFSSNRNNGGNRDTNLFLAEWNPNQ